MADSGVAVLVAEPGAGKTTRVPPRLLEAPWRQVSDGRILVLQPRRLAARLAASYMAGQLGEAVGERIGYRVRDASCCGARTRIELITEGIFLRRIQSDPELEGVAAVIFDEFHLRRLDADLALALAMQARELLRPDLRLLVMSATLDDKAVASLLGEPDRPAPVLRAAGRQFEVEIRHAPPPSSSWVRGPVSDREGLLVHAAEVLRQALRTESGSLLVFLPGEREIRRLAERLTEQGLPADTDLYPLYGRLTVAEQARAVRPSPSGRRKVVLATDIAETSLTIEGVRGVIDLGLSREARYDPVSGLSRLETVTASQAAATQRAGRAGRLEAGFAIRLWSASAEAAHPRHGEPEIRHADLMPLALELACWGALDETELAWLDPPPSRSLARARLRLREMELLDEAGRVTARGRRVQRLPLHPRLGVMLDQAIAWQQAGLGCRLAALVEELPRRAGADLAELLARFETHPELGPARRLATRLARQVGLDRLATGSEDDSVDVREAEIWPGLLAAVAFPDRIARRREAAGRFVLGNGRGAALAASQWLAGQSYLVAVSLEDRPQEARIRQAVALDIEALAERAPWLFTTQEVIDWDAGEKAVRAERREQVGELVIRARPLSGKALADPQAVTGVLLHAIREAGLSVLPFSPAARELLARLRFVARAQPEAGWPAVDEQSLLDQLEHWLAPYLAGMSRFAHLARLDMRAILQARLDWPQRQALDRLAPTRVTVPSGSAIAVDYEADPPVLAVKLQEMFGLRQTPAVLDGRVPLLLHLLSPAGRPVQITRDLVSFWQNGYPEVRKDLKGRYPKHPWPDDPLTAPATRHTKRKNPR